MLPVEQPFKTYTGLDGKPLDNGYVYFGMPNLNPITNPVTVYWDAAGTIPAAQPLRTVNGYIMRAGTPANVFFDGAYSELVQDSKKRQVFFARSSDDFSIASLVIGLSKSLGAGLIGFMQSGIGAAFRTVLDKLRDNVNVRDYGALGDGTDATAAFARASAHSVVRVPAGVYVLDTVDITKSVTFECEPGVIFRRKAGADRVSGSFTSSTGMFSVSTNGVDLRFVGSMTFDGNSSAQTAIEPGGFSIKVAVPASVGAAPISLYMENPTFINGTLAYLLLRGDDVRRRYKTLVTLVNPRFYDTVPGKGKSDPSTPTALGYLPTYVNCQDYVRLDTYDFYAEYSKPTPLGQYAPCAVLGTFAGGSYESAGETMVYMFGHTELVGMGRANNKYNDATEFTTNNGIGCIDLYGNGEELYIQQLTAKNCHSPAARAKGSIKRYTVESASLENCFRGLQVSPSSTGPCEAIVNVGSVTAMSGTIPAVEFTGSSSTDMLRSVTLGSVSCYGAYTNPESLVNEGLVKIRNVAKFSAASVAAIGAPGSAITLDAVQRAHIRALITNSSGLHGLLALGGDQLVVESFDIRNAGGNGIRIAVDTAKVVIEGGTITNTVDYGVANLVTITDATFRDVTVNTVSGLGRAFYTGLGNVTVIGNTARNAAVPFFSVTGVNLHEQHNSWNPREVRGGFSATTTGTWGVGDVVWNSQPVAGGNMGWVCTTAGSPGTWKTFGTVAA